jgi:hypothetical protein
MILGADTGRGSRIVSTYELFSEESYGQLFQKAMYAHVIWCNVPINLENMFRSFMWQYLPYWIIVEKMVFSPTLPGDVRWWRRKVWQLLESGGGAARRNGSGLHRAATVFSKQQNFNINVHFRNSFCFNITYISYFFVIIRLITYLNLEDWRCMVMQAMDVWM